MEYHAFYYFRMKHQRLGAIKKAVEDSLFSIIYIFFIDRLIFHRSPTGGRSFDFRV